VRSGRRPARPEDRRSPAQAPSPAAPLRLPGAQPCGDERRQPPEGVACEALRGGAPEAAAVVNLSEGGACVESPRPLAVDDRLTLLLRNRACLGSLTAAARVAWCEPAGAGYRVGCQFLRPLAAGDLLPFLC
jgi:hypothetical protein